MHNPYRSWPELVSSWCSAVLSRCGQSYLTLQSCNWIAQPLRMGKQSVCFCINGILTITVIIWLVASWADTFLKGCWDGEKLLLQTWIAAVLNWTEYVALQGLAYDGSWAEYSLIELCTFFVSTTIRCSTLWRSSSCMALLKTDWLWSQECFVHQVIHG